MSDVLLRIIKGIVQRDFLTSGFFHSTIYHGPSRHAYKRSNFRDIEKIDSPLSMTAGNKKLDFRHPIFFKILTFSCSAVLSMHG
jgi:hypothetical protein